ncbi:MAG: tRNA epoxyqueuosine(34) reductase QueG [Bacteroidota bacterium]|jgi:epoxyqueuosine reductase
MIQAKEKSILVKEIAQAHGFDQCGIAKAVPLDDDARRLERWLQKGYHGDMHYMENHFDLRVDPTKLVPGAKTVITVLYNYFPDETQQIGIPKIAKYAYGEDYHLVIRKKLQLFLQSVREKMGHVEGRGFVDSAPVLERSWAQRSGLGWIGKNGNLINKKMGSFFFIATLITDLELEPDVPHATDHCGTCSRCVDACPTDAILIDKTVDASKCISYFTIELKSKDLPEDLKSKSENWIFGCDICQDVCPWNRFSKPHQHQELEPFKEIMQFNIEDWLDINEESFKKIFKHSPLKRSGFEGIKRNLRLYQG